MCCTYRLDQRWYRDTVALCFPYGMQRAFCCFKWIQPLPGGLLQREKLYLLMFSRNLFVPDFVRRFFVSCAQISSQCSLSSLMLICRTGKRGRFQFIDCPHLERGCPNATDAVRCRRTDACESQWTMIH